jgi:ribonuclease HI
MELTAVIRGLAAIDPTRPVTIFADSTYALIGEQVTKTSRPRDINRDLWLELIAVASVRTAPIEWRWVKAHSGIANNEHVDVLAGDARLAA